MFSIWHSDKEINNFMEFLIIHILGKGLNHFYFLTIIRFISHLDYCSFSKMIYNFMLEETLWHPIECSLLVSVLSKIMLHLKLLVSGLFPSWEYWPECFLWNVTLLKMGFCGFREEKYMVCGFCLASFFSPYISIRGEHHSLWTDLPVMDVTTFPQWLIFISFKR